MPKHSTQRERNKIEPFLMIKTWELKSPAFRALTGDQVRVYIEMRMRYDGKNNGQIVFGTDTAGKVVHKQKKTGAIILNRLIELGFIKVVNDSSFDQKRLCRTFELTAIARQPAKRKDKLADGSKDFMRWTEAMIKALDQPKRGKSATSSKTKHSVTDNTDSVTHDTASSNIVKFGSK